MRFFTIFSGCMQLRLAVAAIFLLYVTRPSIYTRVQCVISLYVMGFNQISQGVLDFN